VPSLSPGHKFFDPAFKAASGNKNSALAFETFYAYIRPQSHYLPLITAAGVLLLQADYITELDFHNVILTIGF
jgi:hypothetical protein